MKKAQFKEHSVFGFIDTNLFSTYISYYLNTWEGKNTENFENHFFISIGTFLDASWMDFFLAAVIIKTPSAERFEVTSSDLQPLGRV